MQQSIRFPNPTRQRRAVAVPNQNAGAGPKSTAAPTSRKRRRGCFNFEAKRRREIEAHALHVGAAETEDFDRWLVAWQWHNSQSTDPVGATVEASRRMGRDLSEAEAAHIATKAGTYPKRLSADALGMWLGVTYAQREVLRITTIGAANVKKRARKELRKRKDRIYQQRKRLARGSRPQSQSLSRTKPWEAMGISKRTWYRRIADNTWHNFVGSPLSISHDESVPLPSLSSRTAILIAADGTTSSAVERRLQAVPHPPDYNPVAAARARVQQHRNGGRQ
jgi:hypothetical protein